MKSSSSDPEKQADRKSNMERHPYLPAVLIIVFFSGGLIGLFVAFACNGGAGGSSTMGGDAWACLIPYLVIYFVIMGLLIRRWFR